MKKKFKRFIKTEKAKQSPGAFSVRKQMKHGNMPEISFSFGTIKIKI